MPLLKLSDHKQLQQEFELSYTNWSFCELHLIQAMRYGFMPSSKLSEQKRPQLEFEPSFPSWQTQTTLLLQKLDISMMIFTLIKRNENWFPNLSQYGCVVEQRTEIKKDRKINSKCWLDQNDDHRLFCEKGRTCNVHETRTNSSSFWINIHISC